MAASMEVPMMEIEFKPGAHIWFGKERIPWRVLEVDRERETALLIADKPVCEKAYHDTYKDITWEKCDLRAWLNGEYYENTFSDEEKAAIVECELENKDNPQYHTKGGNPTKDKIFLLSIEEAEKYFKNSEDRATGSWWWLRSPGFNSFHAAIVNYDGDFNYIGNCVFSSLGVRPALTINLESDLFQSFILSKSSQSIILSVPQFAISGSVLIGCLKESTFARIPEGVTSIGDRAFKDCSSLTSVTIPEGVTSIGKMAFYNCGNVRFMGPDEIVESLQQSFFQIKNSVLTKYDGPGGDVVIPEGVTSIGWNSFYGCESLTSVTIPASVTEIDPHAFDGCKNLQLAVLPRGTDIWHAAGLSLGVMTTGEKRAYYAYARKDNGDNLSAFARVGYWPDYDRELINNGPAFRYKTPARLLGALGRLLDPAELTEENRALLAELLVKNAKKVIQIAEDTGHPEIAADLVSLPLFDEKTAKTLKKRLAASPVPEIAALAGTTIGTAQTSPREDKPANPLREEYAEKLRSVNGDDVIKKMKLLGTAFPNLKLADGTEAPEELFRFLLASYGLQATGECRFVPEADEAAKLLAYDSLCEAMETVSGHLDGPNYPAVLPLLCRYGNAKQIRTLIKASGTWAGPKGRKASEILLKALVLSDTREAVATLEKKIFGLGPFAALRGISKEEVYERYLFDFGLDENGKRVFDLGTTSVEVTLTPELTLRLWDTSRGKEIRQLPKKGADPAVWQMADDELADMRQNLKKAVKIKNSQLWENYLKGTKIPAESWERSYTGNAFLRAVGSLLVWEQGGETFVISNSGLIDNAGRPRTLTDAPVRLAHPMEMTSENVKAWQKYFTTLGLKQPFAQIWEPVINFAGISPDRYKGCRINPLYLKNQQKRGITADWYSGSYTTSKYLRFEGFEVTAGDAPAEPGDTQQYLQILSIVPEQRNRRTNMVLGYLDRITMYGRLRKDDVSVMERMDDFTLAQVTDFIAAAQEAQAVNVLALLLEYKNNRFADFNPMDEFTLEW